MSTEIVENSYVLLTALNKTSSLAPFHGLVGIVAKIDSQGTFILMRDGNGVVMPTNTSSENLRLASIDAKMVCGLVKNDLRVYLGRLRKDQQTNQQTWNYDPVIFAKKNNDFHVSGTIL